MPRKTSVLALIISATLTHAQTTVTINDGQTLTESDLLAGAFNGQPFTLAPTTTFEVNNGGAIGPVGDFGPVPTGPFGFEGSTINLNAGAQFISNPPTTPNFDASFISNAEVNVFLDANIGNNLNAFEGSRINVHGGTIGDFPIIHDSQVILYDGSIGDVLDATNTDIQLINGIIGDGLRAKDGTTVHISDGVVGGNVSLRSGAAFDIIGGAVMGRIDVEPNASFSITSGAVLGTIDVDGPNNILINGGQIDRLNGNPATDIVIDAGDIDALQVTNQASVTTSAGTIGRAFIEPDAQVTIRGNDFRRNGQPITAIEGGLPRGSRDTFSCTLTDGAPLIWYAETGDIEADITLIETAVPTASTEPIIVDSTTAPPGLRQGQTLTLTDGGVLPYRFNVVSATLNMNGGLAQNITAIDSAITMTDSAADEIVLINSTIDIQGGSLSIEAHNSNVTIENADLDSIAARHDSEVLIRNGTHGMLEIGSAGSVEIQGGNLLEFLAFDHITANISGGVIDEFNCGGYDTTLNISGGDVGLASELNTVIAATINVEGGRLGRLYLFKGSVTNISGGFFDDHLTFLNGATGNISGGRFNRIFADPGSTLNFFVLDATLDAAELPLGIGESIDINETDGTTLQLTLADRTPLTVELDWISFQDPAGRDEDAIVTVTRTRPCPCEFGGNPATIEITDLLVYLDHWFAQERQADINDDTVVNIADLLAFLDCWLPANLGNGCG